MASAPCERVLQELGEFHVARAGLVEGVEALVVTVCEGILGDGRALLPALRSAAPHEVARGGREKSEGEDGRDGPEGDMVGDLEVDQCRNSCGGCERLEPELGPDESEQKSYGAAEVR